MGGLQIAQRPLTWSFTGAYFERATHCLNRLATIIQSIACYLPTTCIPRLGKRGLPYRAQGPESVLPCSACAMLQLFPCLGARSLHRCISRSIQLSSALRPTGDVPRRGGEGTRC